jgi:hypothetical protein
MSEIEHYMAAVGRLVAENNRFRDEMRKLGIHVALGQSGTCVTCGQAWPCEGTVGPTSLPD